MASIRSAISFRKRHMPPQRRRCELGLAIPWHAKEVTITAHDLQNSHAGVQRPMPHTQQLQRHSQVADMPHIMLAASRRAHNPTHNGMHGRQPVAVTEHGNTTKCRACPHSMPAVSRRADNSTHACMHMRQPLAVAEHGQRVTPGFPVQQVRMPIYSWQAPSHTFSASTCTQRVRAHVTAASKHGLVQHGRVRGPRYYTEFALYCQSIVSSVTLAQECTGARPTVVGSKRAVCAPVKHSVTSVQPRFWWRGHA